MAHILIVDDEPSIVDNVVYALNQEGMASSHANTGNAAFALLQQQSFDLVVLDIGLPDISGIEVCKKIRETSDIPIIFLTARDEEIDRVLGLELGADDYVTKPFSPRELSVRIKNILRRVERQHADVPADKEFRVDDARKQIYFKGLRLDLTPLEFGILGKLLDRPGQVYSRDLLMDLVWSDHADASDRVIDTHIKSIRSKLHQVDAAANPIKTHRGFGYSVTSP